MRKPTIIIPYTGQNCTGCVDDVFLYLRPETNGISVESTLMGVLRGTPAYREKAELVYLANLPGDFIINNHIIEEHYSVNYRFACSGKRLFTPLMKKSFEDHFQEDSDTAVILGAFEALEYLKISEESLFNIWVSEKDMLFINGQSIKKYDNIYIINYDIPALLHKNNYSTDIAVMILRSSLNRDDFNGMIRAMEDALISKGIMDGNKPPSRYFHYSKGPFEQILDGLGYLYTPEGEHLPVDNVSFAGRLLSSGISLNEIMGIIHNPIMAFNENEKLIEDNIFMRTRSKSFDEAMDVLKSARSQFYLK